MVRLNLGVGIIFVSLILIACGGGEEAQPTPTPTATESPETAAPTKPTVVPTPTELPPTPTPQAEFSRALVISATVIGAPAAGYDVVSLSVDPPVVTVFGPQSFIGEAVTIRTQPIDISGATDDVVRTVSLDLPPDVSVSGGTSVTVTIEIEPAQGRQTLEVTVIAVGLDPGLSVKGALPLVQVVLLGELPALQALRPNDIAATINLSGLGEGTHTVSVAVSAPTEVSVASISPETVEITLEPR
jgi:YbbR domain-containing protein